MSIIISLFDGKKLSFEHSITPLKIAQIIGHNLDKEIVLAKINDKFHNLDHVIEQSSDLIFVEKKDALNIIRHSCAHILAEAVQELYPNTLLSIGPVIDDGFYYDFDQKTPFSLDDFLKIEQKMHDIIDKNYQIVCKNINKEKAYELFAKKGEKFKLEILESISDCEKITIYFQGNNVNSLTNIDSISDLTLDQLIEFGWFDLCQGPHITFAKDIGHAFKLLNVAGAYWKGDSKNVMLQRIYGTCWLDQDDLNNYLQRLEDVKKWDHRNIIKKMDLLHIDPENSGMIFWHPKGWVIFSQIQQYIRNKIKKAGYDEVNTPILLDSSIWKKSGHWDKFYENMFILNIENNKQCALKPMNCPAHIEIFKQGVKSYRDLPLRLAEFGSCHRAEPSGSLHGIMRIRNFVQDDAHIFCTEDQIFPEVSNFCKLLIDIYQDFGFENISVKFSDRPKSRVGDDTTWELAETKLCEAIKFAGLEYTINSGEGAFYGPKLEFILQDNMNRQWQCGTLQLDFNLAKCLNATYIDSNNNPQYPIILHRAILGSLERFIGILLEHYKGNLPLWLAPIQIAICTLNQNNHNYVQQLHDTLSEQDFRVILDNSSNTISYKIQAHIDARIPIILIIGKKEVQNNTISVRMLGEKDSKIMSFDDLIEMLKINLHKLKQY